MDICVWVAAWKLRGGVNGEDTCGFLRGSRWQPLELGVMGSGMVVAPAKRHFSFNFAFVLTGEGYNAAADSCNGTGVALEYVEGRLQCLMLLLLAVRSGTRTTPLRICA